VYVCGPDVSVSVPLDGVAAKLNIASMAPTEQKQNANKTRGLKRPDCEAGFFFIMISGCYIGIFEKLMVSGCLLLEINAARFQEDYFSVCPRSTFAESCSHPWMSASFFRRFS